MGLFDEAYKTYDYHSNIAGFAINGMDPLAPCAHSVTRADLDITVDEAGHFIQAHVVDKKEPKIVFPVTEASLTRSGVSVQPHPLCEHLQYLVPYHEQKRGKYLQQLSDWINSDYSNSLLLPIYLYVRNGTIVDDLCQANLVSLQEDGRLEKDKLFIRWRVLENGKEEASPCWLNQDLFKAFTNYYLDQKEKTAEKALCMVTSEVKPIAKLHPRGVFSLAGNAKIISSNDKNNFIYRGRFTAPEEAVTVSFEASQKAHNVLRWLISNQGIIIGNRVFICWEPQQIELPNIFGMRQSLTESEQEIIYNNVADYRQMLKSTLQGWEMALPEDGGKAVIASFEAATKGRLSVTYYSELYASDFLKRIKKWDETCCWYRGSRGICSTSIREIIDCAYGSQRISETTEYLVTDDELVSYQMQRLMSCRIDATPIPFDIVQSLVHRASSPEKYSVKIRSKILNVACAVIQKYRYDKYKEECTMALEPEKKDRSYQFGRLLAILEKIEKETYKESETRDTSAIKMQSVFADRPLYAARIIWQHVRTVYEIKLSKKDQDFFEDRMQNIMSLLSEYPDDVLRKPLNEMYLMGYYLERSYLYNNRYGGTNK